MIEFSFQYDNKNYNVFPTKHLEDSKFNNSLKRGDFFNAENTQEILEAAIKNNLTSFRNKGLTVIFFKDWKNIINSFLIDFVENNITIITIYRDFSGKNYDVFRTVKNRINLINEYIFSDKNKFSKNYDEFYENTCGISTGIKKVENKNKKLIILKKKKDMKKSNKDILNEPLNDDDKYFLRNII